MKKAMGQECCIQGKLTSFGSALTARMTFLFSRNMTYKFIYDRVKPRKVTNDLSPREKGVLGAIAGAVGATLSNGAEVTMVRQIGDLGRAAKFQRGNPVLASMGRGLSASILRAAALSSILTIAYDDLKTRIRITFGDTFIDKPLAMLLTTGIATMAILPIDNLKTRLQYQYSNPALNRLNYGNRIDAALEMTLRNEGFASLYAGAIPYYLKIFVYAMSVS